MKVLVTGGAGYIGSVIAAGLLAAGHTVTVYDDLSRGHRAAVTPGAELVVADIRDTDRLTAALTADGCEAIVHMAALAEVAESVAFPQRYHDVNVGGTRSVLAAAQVAGVSRLVFSSTAAVYGAPETIPIDEDALLARPTLTARRSSRRAVAVRGGRRRRPPRRRRAALLQRRRRRWPARRRPRPESHLVPLALKAARDGTALTVFGDDYPTTDGTCIRDYVHVRDLADAHIAALEGLPRTAGAYNLGTGSGSSVLEVLRAVAAATGRGATVERAGRRPGDPPVLVASNDRARRLLSWQPRRPLEIIVGDAWAWLSDHPRGYDDRPSAGS